MNQQCVASNSAFKGLPGRRPDALQPASFSLAADGAGRVNRADGADEALQPELAPDQTPADEQDDSKSVTVMRITVAALALLCVILTAVLLLPPNINGMTDGVSGMVCADQQQALASYESIEYQGEALTWLTLDLDGVWGPYDADQLGLAQQNTTRFRDDQGNTLFYLTTSDEWGGLIGVTMADSNRTVVYRIR